MRRHQCVAAINECLYKRPAARMWLVAVERAQQFGGRPGLVVCRCHDREMSMLVTGWVGSTTSGVIAEVVGHSLSERSARAKEYREGRKTTAAELATPLREFQSLLRRYGKEPVDRAEVETACWNWSVTLAAQGHRLPWEWRHVPRNVREAVGTVFGAVVHIYTDPEAKKMELSEPHAMWQKFAVDYLEAVTIRLLKWGDSVRGVSIVEEHYDAWLARTGRRAPYGTIAAPKLVRSQRDTGRQQIHARRMQRGGRPNTPAVLAAPPDIAPSDEPQ